MAENVLNDSRRSAATVSVAFGFGPGERDWFVETAGLLGIVSALEAGTIFPSDEAVPVVFVVVAGAS